MQARRQANRKEKDTTLSQAGDVVSLDDDETQRRVEDTSPSHLPQVICLGLAAVLVLAYFWVERKTCEHDFKGTYEELAIQHIGEYLVKQYAADTASCVLVVPPWMAKSLDHNWLQYFTNVVKDKIELLPTESSQSSLAGTRGGGGDDVPLTGARVKEIMGRYPKATMLVVLTDLAPAIEPADWPKGKRPEIVLFSTSADLNLYVQATKLSYLDRVVLGRGNFPPDAQVPCTVPLEELFNRHFLEITRANAKHIDDAYRQMIFRFPLDRKEFPH